MNDAATEAGRGVGIRLEEDNTDKKNFEKLACPPT